MTHPSFIRAAALSEPLRSHFAKSVEEVYAWQPLVTRHALSARVLAVARTRVEFAWAAYIDSVRGIDHGEEMVAVLDSGAKLDEAVARALFPLFAEVPYAP